MRCCFQGAYECCTGLTADWSCVALAGAITAYPECDCVWPRVLNSRVARCQREHSLCHGRSSACVGTPWIGCNDTEQARVELLAHHLDNCCNCSCWCVSMPAWSLCLPPHHSCAACTSGITCAHTPMASNCCLRCFFGSHHQGCRAGHLCDEGAFERC